MSKRSLIFVCLLFMLWGSGAAAVRETVRFKPGTDSAEITGNVIRGEVDRYELTAKEGQTMTVSITAEEDNAAFTIYLPGWEEKTEDDMTFIEGATLTGAGEGEDAVNCEAKLPAGGRYLIEVGGTRGNASYKLKITIQ
ncbi:MAG: hypothetical protein AB7V45_17770 [Candidatus Krumholzibacteriia bacterium]